MKQFVDDHFLDLWAGALIVIVIAIGFWAMVALSSTPHETTVKELERTVQAMQTERPR